MTVETLYADASVVGSVTGPENALGAPDNVWTTTTGNTNWAHRWSMQNPVNPVMTGTHTITVRARKEPGQSGTPSIIVYLIINNGGVDTNVKTLVASTSVTSTTGQDFSGTFTNADIAAYGNPTHVEVTVDATSAGGSPSARTTVQVDAITWTGDFSSTSSVTSSTPSSWNVRVPATLEAATSWHTAAQVTRTAAVTWNVATPVTKTSATSWHVPVPVAAPATKATSWNVRSSVTSTVSTTWNVRATADMMSASTFNVRSASAGGVTYWNGSRELSCTVFIWDGVQEVPVTLSVTD